MKKEVDYKGIHSFDELLDAKYGRQGNPDRDAWEQEYEAFKIGVIIHDLRKKRKKRWRRKPSQPKRKYC